ncbi:MAG: hypothetical protein A2Z28_05550 [Chloroflexi bacterium RBG_16_51_9]|nr:MAG: hypothetical protein A2Z28_05550 [Chloroflexi bacterium RBG_16_51_9]
MRRTTHIDEQDSQLDFGAARAPPPEVESPVTELRVLVVGAVPDKPHDEASRAVQRGVAILAAMLGRDYPEDATIHAIEGYLAGKHAPPGLFSRLLGQFILL